MGTWVMDLWMLENIHFYVKVLTLKLHIISFTILQISVFNMVQHSLQTYTQQNM